MEILAKKRSTRGDFLAMRYLLMVLSPLVPLMAADHTVGPLKDYTSIQACITAMNNGDRCIVYAGTYDEKPALKQGTSGNLNTVMVNPGDTVTVKAFTMASYTVLEGFQVTDATLAQSCVTVPSGTTQFTIKNNTFQYCGAPGMYSGIAEAVASTPQATFGYIQNNTFTWVGANSTAGQAGANPRLQGGTAIYVNGDHHLIEGNDISHVLDGMLLFGKWNIARNNTMHDTDNQDFGGDPLVCDPGGAGTRPCSDNNGDDHIDFIESWCAVGMLPPIAFTLAEGNTMIRNVNTNGTNAHWGTAQYCSAPAYYILRYNLMAHVGAKDANGNINGGGYGILDNSGGYHPVKMYNNTEVAMGEPNNAVDGFMSNATNGAVINTIYYFPTAISISPYYVDDMSALTFKGRNNMAACGSTTCTILGKNGTDAWSVDSGNTVQDPLFVSYAADDFHLQSSSPALRAGSYLTKVTSATGSGTTFSVADASFFQDGWGFPSGIGIAADWIQIGSSTTVQISSIDYSANTITVQNSVSWNNNDVVNLYQDSRGQVVLSGSAPNIGAFSPCNSIRDSNTGTSTGSIGVGQYSGSYYVAMPFKAGSNYTLCSVTLRMAKAGNPPNMSMSIYSDRSGSPWRILGTASGSFNSSSLSTTEGDANFVGLKADLTTGNLYWIVVNLPSGDGTNYANWYLTNGGASNGFWSSPNGAAPWTNQDTFVIGKFSTFSQ